eukprot:1814625-Amphidinium_carterae.1
MNPAAQLQQRQFCIVGLSVCIRQTRVFLAVSDDGDVAVIVCCCFVFVAAMPYYDRAKQHSLESPLLAMTTSTLRVH